MIYDEMNKEDLNKQMENVGKIAENIGKVVRKSQPEELKKDASPTLGQSIKTCVPSTVEECVLGFEGVTINISGKVKHLSITFIRDKEENKDE